MLYGLGRSSPSWGRGLGRGTLELRLGPTRALYYRGRQAPKRTVPLGECSEALASTHGITKSAAGSRPISNSFFLQSRYPGQEGRPHYQYQPYQYQNQPPQNQQQNAPPNYPQQQHGYNNPHGYNMPPLPPPPPPRPKKKWAMIFIASGCLLWFLLTPAGTSREGSVLDLPSILKHVLAGGQPEEILDPNEFRTFKVISREPLSQGSDVQLLRLRPDPMPNVYHEDPMPNYGDGWSSGMWHVEIKHPDIQVSREYTPFPPVVEDSYHIRQTAHALERLRSELEEEEEEAPGSNHRPLSEVDLAKLAQEKRDEDALESIMFPLEMRCDLVFAIRPLSDGVVSRYLCSLPVGSPVYLRGPHPGFNILARSGVGPAIIDRASSNHVPVTKEGAQQRAADEEEEIRDEVRLVCIVGGTGIASAMQALNPAHTLLDHEGTKYRANILWATRLAKEAITGPVGQAFSEGGVVGHNPMLGSQYLKENALSRWFIDHASELGMTHGGLQNVQIRCFSNDEGTRISPRDIERALLEAPKGWKTSKPMPPANQYCHYHSAFVLSQSPEGDPPEAACTCPAPENTLPRKHILLVSGPPAFVEDIAGPKYWSGGRQLQGRIGGVLGELEQKHPGIFNDWLVLKL